MLDSESTRIHYLTRPLLFLTRHLVIYEVYVLATDATEGVEADAEPNAQRK